MMGIFQCGVALRFYIVVLICILMNKSTSISPDGMKLHLYLYYFFFQEGLDMHMTVVKLLYRFYD